MTQPPSNDQSLALIPTDAPPKHGRGAAASPFLHRVDPDAQIRPQTLDDIIGQPDIKETLAIYIRAARGRSSSLDHTLITGPAGLGKTTIANVIAHEMGHQLRVLTGPQVSPSDVISLAGYLASAGSETSPRMVVFIDEIHALHKEAQTLLLPMMEDFQFEDLHFCPFTLIGATTDPAKLLGPMLDRFQIQYQLEYYPDADIEEIIKRSLSILLGIDRPAIDQLCQPIRVRGKHKPSPTQQSITMLANRSRGVPRTANHLIRRTLDYMYVPDSETKLSLVQSDGSILQSMPEYRPLTPDIVMRAMRGLGIDKNGLNRMDRKILATMLERFGGRAVGIKSIAAAVGESAGNLETTIEPNLVRRGFINRELRGRRLSPSGMIIAAHELEGKTEY